MAKNECNSIQSVAVTGSLQYSLMLLTLASMTVDQLHRLPEVGLS